MRELSAVEVKDVSGANTAPTCSTQTVTIKGSNGVSATFYVTVCECPAGTSMQTTTTSTGAAVTCKN